ncbi:MAG: response regulator [Myxococcota bacterium]|nr:response regulator [Myxococcota bacterium]
MAYQILIIDDDPLFRQFMRALLVDAGHDVLEADNGRLGIEIYESQTPELVITDLVMPEQEGLQTIRILAEASLKPKIIAISGGIDILRGGSSDTEEWLEIAAEFGADAVMEKPISPDHFVATVAAVLKAEKVARKE